jgi:two-component system, response regulator YesN
MGTYRVLLVDDEPIIKRSLRVALPWDELDMTIVGEASNGEEALQRIQELRPHIVISDIRMPVMDGISMMKEAVHRDSSLLFVLLSGYGEFEYAREAIRRGAFDYLLKPVDHEELETVMKEAKAKLDHEAEQQSEWEFLTRSSQALSSLVRERMISSMIEGSEAVFHPAYWLRGWDLEHPYVMLVITFDDTLEVDSWSREDRKLWLFAVGNVLTEFGESCGAFTVFPFRSGEWVMLLPNADAELAKRTAHEMIATVKSCTKLSCSVGISRQHQGLEALYAGYTSAQRALLDRFARGGEQVYLDRCEAGASEEAKGSSEHSRRLAVSPWEKKLTEALIGYDRALLAALLEEWMKELRTGGLHSADAAALMIELSVGISRRLSDVNGVALPGLKALISSLPRCGTLQEAHQLLLGKLLEYNELAGDRTSREEELRSIRKAVEYIDERFHHDLSIDEVSEFIGLSCSHFCVLFKKESGLTFLEYVTKLRIERACSILRNTEVKVYQVAPMVGYQDPKYFTQVFKRMKGVTPSEYRAAAQAEG